jgi:hypothetical protein
LKARPSVFCVSTETMSLRYSAEAR